MEMVLCRFAMLPAALLSVTFAIGQKLTPLELQKINNLDPAIYNMMADNGFQFNKNQGEGFDQWTFKTRSSPQEKIGSVVQRSVDSDQKR